MKVLITFLLITFIAQANIGLSKEVCSISNLPNENPIFTGRETDLNTLYNALNKDTLGEVTVTGIAGIGKTQIVKKYAVLNKGNYDIVWWIDANQDIALQLRKLGILWGNNLNQYIINPLSDSQETTNQILKALTNTSLRWLLIYDNAKSYHAIENYLPKAKNNLEHHILVTSKVNEGWKHPIKLDTFKRPDSIKLLRKIGLEDSEHNLNILAAALNDYPLAIAQAGAFIKVNPIMDAYEYKDLFTTKQKALWDYEHKIFDKKEFGNEQDIFIDNYKGTFKSVLELSIKDVINTSKEAYNLLLLCSVLEGSGIPENILKHYFGKDTVSLNQALKVLKKYFLINVKEAKMGQEKIFDMHEVEQQIIRSSVSSEKINEVIEQALNSLNSLIPSQIDLSIPMLTANNQYLHNIEKLLLLAKQHEIINNDYLSLKIRYLEFYLSGKRDCDKATPILQGIETEINDYPQVSTINRIRYYIMKSAYITWKYEDNIGGILEIKNAYNLLQTLENSSEEMLMVYNRLSQNYYFMGDFDESKKYSDLAKEVIERTEGYLGNKDAFYGNRARLYAEQGDFEEALLSSGKSIEEIERLQAYDNIIGLLPAYTMQADILLDAGKFQEAYKKSLSLHELITKASKGQLNYVESHTLNILAESALRLGKVDFAEEKVKESLNILIQLYGDKENTRHNAAAHMTLGNVYTYKKEFEKAQEEYLRSEEIFHHILKNKKIHKIGKLYSALALNAVELKDGFLAKHYFNELKETFGPVNQYSYEVIERLNDKGLPLP